MNRNLAGAATPRPIDQEQIDDLEDLASVVMDQLELRLAARQAVSQANLMAGEISTMRWQDMPPTDKRPGIMPDLLVPGRFADWRVGHDAALEAALADETTKDQGDHTLTGPWERLGQKQAWNPFWMEGAPPTVTPVWSPVASSLACP